MILLHKAKQLFKQKFDSINNEKLKRNLLNALPFWVGAIMCGGVAVLYAKIFALAEKGSHYMYEQLGWACFIITPVCLLLHGGLLLNMLHLQEEVVYHKLLLPLNYRTQNTLIK
jgi:hypothetical protein